MAKSTGRGGGAAGARAKASPTGASPRGKRSQPPAMSVAEANAAVAASLLSPSEQQTPPTTHGPPIIDHAAAAALNPLALLSEQAGIRRPDSVAAAPAASAAMDAARMVAQQQAEYQRSVELVRQQMAQRQLQQQAAAAYQAQLQQLQTSAAPGNAAVMQQIQQRLHERIQLKNHQQHHPMYDAAQQQSESLAMQQQLQQYHAMLREMEMQTASVPSTGMSQEDIDRVRQERLHRLHQMQMHKMQQQQHQQLAAEHAAALRVTLTGVPPPVAMAEQHHRMQAQIEADRLRLLQQQQAVVPVHESTTSKPLITPKKRDEATASADTATTAAAPQKKKRKTQSESHMEGLVRVLCRLHLSRNESETRTQLDKMAAWISKTVDLCLLRFARRDFAEIFGVKQKQFEKSTAWPGELLPKFTYIHDKLRHTIAALENAARPKPASSTTESSPASVAAEDTTTAQPVASDDVTLAAREDAYAALKEQMMTSMIQPKAPKPATTPPPANESVDAKKAKKKELQVDVSAAYRPTHSISTTISSTASSTPATRPVAAVPRVISPTVAQQLFDLDLAQRSCAMAPDEGEDRFYFPSKSIAAVMRKVLPGGFTGSIRRRGRRRIASVNGVKEEKKTAEEEDEDDDEGDEKEDAGNDEMDEDLDEGKANNATETTATPSLLAAKAEEPPVKIDDAAVAFMQECVSEFLLFFTSEARDLSLLDKKKGSITGTNVVHAMENMGFDAYAKVLGSYNDKVRRIQDDQAQQKLERKAQAKQRKLQEAQLQRQQQLAAATPVAAVASTTPVSAVVPIAAAPLVPVEAKKEPVAAPVVALASSSSS